MRSINFRRFLSLVLCTFIIIPNIGQAQAVVSVIIRVNQAVITQYEFDQRVLFLEMINASGDLYQLARMQLIDDRLKNEVAGNMNIHLLPEQIDQALTEFASSGNLSLEDFTIMLEKNSVDLRSAVDFIVSGLIWREVVQQKFAARIQITDADIDRAYQARLEGSAMRVLLSEIIMPISNATYTLVTARARQISKLTSIHEFAEAAKQYSIAQTRDSGGQLDWSNVNNLPPALQSLIISLTPGQVTEPIPIDGGVALFQLRDIEETTYRTPSVAVVDYMTYQLVADSALEAQQQAQTVASIVDNCEDLYGIAKGQPEGRLQRQSRAPEDIPTGEALAMAKLDRNEIFVNPPVDDDGSVTLLMVCGRTAEKLADLSRQDVIRGLRNQRLTSYAEQYLQQLRDSAYIIEP